MRLQWFTRAGFSDVKIKRIGPKWYRGVRRHGLIMGCSVTGIKRKVWISCAPSSHFCFPVDGLRDQALAALLCEQGSMGRRLSSFLLQCAGTKSCTCVAATAMQQTCKHL